MYKKIKKLIPNKLKHNIKSIFAGLLGGLLFNKVKTNLIKDQYAGKRCFIIGGGPSLSGMDLSVLNDEYTMVVNRGFELTKLGLKSSNFYGISDLKAMNDYGLEIPTDYAENYCVFGKIPVVKEFPNLSKFNMYLDYHKNKSTYEDFFQFNLKQPVAHSYTVVLQMLQLAVWLGFKEIYFIGVDNNFKKVENIHWYKDTKQEKINIDTWTNFDPSDYNAKSFNKCYNILKQHGVNIYNAGIGGSLNEIPRVEFNSLFTKKKDNKEYE